MELEDAVDFNIIVDEDMDATLVNKHEDILSKGLYQVTEKNSENASAKPPSQLDQHHMISLLCDDEVEALQRSGGSNDVRSS